LWYSSPPARPSERDILSISLIRRSPDFLERLAMSFFCPVPTDTPVVPGGAVTDAPGDIGASTVPSAGPYYVAEALAGEYTILKRNPNYRGPRPHDVDAIALREGVDPGQAVARVESGAWDAVTNLGDGVMDPDGQVSKRWGSGGTLAAKSGQRYYAVSDGELTYLELNAGRPLFSDRQVREAVAFALDRRALSQFVGDQYFNTVVGAQPTDQLFPPDQPGSSGPSVFPIDGPNLAKAKALMRGGHGAAVLVTNAYAPQPQMAQEIKTELAAIGIDVRVKVLDCCTSDAIQEPGAPYDLKIGASAWGIGAMPWIEQLLSVVPPGGPSLHNWSTLPPAWESPTVRALVAQLPNARTEADGLALVHGPIQHEVPMTGIGYTVAGEFFSPRVGCRVFPPASFGVDLAALCVAS
jgi:ABC-type transport system substrate-binding protein